MTGVTHEYQMVYLLQVHFVFAGIGLCLPLYTDYYRPYFTQPSVLTMRSKA